MTSKQKKTANKPSAPSKLRIIGGTWRGRQLPFVEVDGLRPTGDRVRETLFNWLAAWVPDSHCLDLFAGSGALGFEALSRGAADVTMVESNSSVVVHLRENARRLAAHGARVIHSNALAYLGQPAPLGQSGSAVDLVFIDPPFSQNLWQSVIDSLTQVRWLADNAFIYIESPSQAVFNVPANWDLHKRKRAGQVEFALYRVS